MKCDFSGYATRNDLKCADGRFIRKDAFKDCDGKRVPLVWNHEHGDPGMVLGHSILENRKDGVYSYNFFNDTESGQAARTIVEHGDVFGLSIYANHLKQNGNDVVHGVIREVSLVLAGANPGAYIDSVMAHGEEEGDAAYIRFTSDGDGDALAHSACELPESLLHSDKEQKDESKTEEKKDDKAGEKEETLKDVFDTLTEKQKTAVYAIIGALESQDNSSDTKEDDVKHNVFENDETQATSNVICHSDQARIMADAKKVGSFRAALEMYAADNALQHDDETASDAADAVAAASGFDDESLGLLFPEYRDVRPGAPELVTYDQGWVTRVMNKVGKIPYSRVRTRQVDIRGIDEIRARGYEKGHKKALSGNYALARRTTDPQTVTVKSALNRDDVVDITDFDYVAYQYRIDRLQLNEELAMAVMLGDFRQDDDPDKIHPDKIRPIWSDDELYAIHTDVDIEAARAELQGSDTGVYFGDNFVTAEAIITAALYAREQYKGSGNMDFFCDPHLLNVMTLARDRNGHRMFASKADLAAALDVNGIYTVEQFANKTREIPATATTTAKTKKLMGIFVNLADYSIGATKGGEITHFNQFDIDFNQLKSLLETRCSGALTRIKSAIVLEEDVTGNP